MESVRSPGCKAIASNKFPLLMQVSSPEVAVQWALAFLGCMRHLANRPCLVLDIDGTILLNMADGTTKCVSYFHALVKACVANGITVFVITARPDEPYNRTYTLKQLNKCGITPVEKLYMRPEDAEYSSYKFNARKDITSQGYTILLTIGDQFADISEMSTPAIMEDTQTYVGQISDHMQFGIKLPSEFA